MIFLILGEVMKWIILGCLLVSTASADTSKVIPAFIEASKIYLSNSLNKNEGLFVRPDILAALKVLQEKNVEPDLLKVHASTKNVVYPLRMQDRYDAWILNPSQKSTSPKIAVHASKFTVIEESDDWTGDDIYLYFLVTDGVIPTGKVSSIYKGLSHTESFFFNDQDRRIYPSGISSKIPAGHLIIDYGIIESDGDDIKDLQKLSAVIIDLAMAVYATYEGNENTTIINLRKEVKALSEYLLDLNNDDRLVTGTIAYSTEELSEMLKNSSFVEIQKKYKSRSDLDSWEYKIYFRFIKGIE